jgi:hypothetical protein
MRGGVSRPAGRTTAALLRSVRLKFKFAAVAATAAAAAAAAAAA